MLFIIPRALSGLLVSYVGFVNIFWGNDPYYGLSVFSLSVFFFYPLLVLLNQLTPERARSILLLGIAVLIFVSSLGVGELGGKIELMLMSFPKPNITGI